MISDTWAAPIPLLSSHHRYLHLAILFAALPYFYSHYNEQRRIASFSVEQALVVAWDKVITQPTVVFRKAVVGFNCNVDLIVPGTQILEYLNATVEANCANLSGNLCKPDSDRESLGSVQELSEAFAHFFARGAAAERFMDDEDTFQKVIKHAESSPKAQYHIGGNAALMAERIASAFPRTEAYLVGPIGPRSNALLHPSIKRTNSTRIVKDEVHVIMEYKQGEILAEYVAPASSRFITSHDKFSGSTVVIEMFFKAISQIKPDLVILTGVHLLEFQQKEMRLEKLRMLKRNVLQVDSKIPIHLELGSMGDAAYIKEVLERIIPHVDSLGLNEQELAFISHVAGGPYTNEYPVQAGTVHVHKVVEMLHWLLRTYGRDRSSGAEGKKAGYRLQRIHFHCLTYHVVVSVGTDWSNLAAGLAAGARLAGRMACSLTDHRGVDQSDLLEVRTAHTLLLDKHMDKKYTFEPHNPIASWMRDDLVFIYTPVLVCKLPSKTVGVDDAISTTGLLFSQFYKFDSNIHW
ncbi:hypothetical protein PMAYCL1PPCAC_06415 [Pristionchus mayeri]|uniref:ADP-dependent glucokinase n=1 Tax=Pristionchus mayeri TaxID=1317129 RepID=A0AAN4ZEK4_9BILA|nr:hypothetical protein PMAYCL1PPCAC_06415 [Pristionchus mayeri]